MIYEEDIEAAVETAISILGPQGRILPSKNTVVYNFHLYNPLTGTIWYGDIDVVDDMPKIKKISEATNLPLFLMTQDKINDGIISGQSIQNSYKLVMEAEVVVENGKITKHRYLAVEA